MESLRPFARFLFFAVYTSAIVAEIWLRNVVQGVEMRRSMRVRRRWAIHLLRGLGVRVSQTGIIPDFPCLIVSNHRSYIDPILLLQHVDAYPVAKAELANWPIIGKGAKLAGIWYINRENVKSRASTLQGISDIIASGYAVIIFPEGTTSDVEGTLPFKRGVFQLASKSSIPIVPVAISFQERDDYWVGEETFLSHAGRRFRQKKIHVSVHYGPTQYGGDPEILMETSRLWIEAQLKISSSRNPVVGVKA